MQNQTLKSEWYESWFNQLYPKIYPDRNLEEASQQVDAVIRLLGKGHSCLDIACGTGRHLKFLAQYFTRSVGLDLSEDLIAIGKNLGNFNKSEVYLSDMRYPKLEEKFDLVTNFFTGVGYFKTDFEHKEMLSKWRTLIKPKGSILIDYLNRDNVISNMETKAIKVIDGYKVTVLKSLTKDKLRVEKHIEIESETDKQSFYESVRMYTFEEIKNLLDFKSIEAYGDFEWNGFDKYSPRLILVGKS